MKNWMTEALHSVKKHNSEHNYTISWTEQRQDTQLLTTLFIKTPNGYSLNRTDIYRIEQLSERERGRYAVDLLPTGATPH